MLFSTVAATRTIIVMVIMAAGLCVPRIAATQTSPQKPTPQPPKIVAERVSIHARTLSFLQSAEQFHSSVKTNLLADGEPITPSASFIADDTLKDALDKLGSAFDYEWTVTRGDIILLNKRFTAREELPQTNLSEMRQMFRDFSSALRIVPPAVKDANLGDLFQQLAVSMTQAQLQRMEARELTGADLALGQADLLETAMLNHYFRDAPFACDRATALLEGMEKSSLVVKKRGLPAAVPPAGNAAVPGSPAAAEVSQNDPRGLESGKLDCYYFTRDKGGRPLQAYLVAWNVAAPESSLESTSVRGQAAPLWAVEASPLHVSDDISVNLSRDVHLELGATTLEKIVASLSKQTGITIEAAEYLRERRLVSFVDNVSARTVLNALASLNDWEWKETEEKHIRIARRTFRMRADAASVPRLMQAAVPKDWRTFLHMPPPSANLEEVRSSLRNTEIGAADVNAAENKLFLWLRDTQRHLFASMGAEHAANDMTHYSELKERDRSDLLIQILVPSVLHLKVFGLLHYDLSPFVTNLGKDRLYFHGNEFAVRAYDGDQSTDFAISIRQ